MKNVEEQIEKIVQDTVVYMISKDRGYGFAEDGMEDMNEMEVPDVPKFLMDLRDAEILPNNGRYVQYTVDDNESGFQDMCTKYIVFDDGEVKGVIPFDEVIAEQDWEYKGLKEEGFRKLVKALIA